MRSASCRAPWRRWRGLRGGLRAVGAARGRSLAGARRTGGGGAALGGALGARGSWRWWAWWWCVSHDAPYEIGDLELRTANSVARIRTAVRRTCVRTFRAAPRVTATRRAARAGAMRASRPRIGELGGRRQLLGRRRMRGSAPSMPSRATTRVAEALAVLVLAQLHLEARAAARGSPRAASARRAGGRAPRAAAAGRGRAARPAASMTCSAWPSTSAIVACILRRAGRGARAPATSVTRPPSRARSHRRAQVVERRHAARRRGRGDTSAEASSSPTRPPRCGPQPRHGGELHGVRHLVDGDPGEQVLERRARCVRATRARFGADEVAAAARRVELAAAQRDLVLAEHAARPCSRAARRSRRRARRRRPSAARRAAGRPLVELRVERLDRRRAAGAMFARPTRRARRPRRAAAAPRARGRV